MLKALAAGLAFAAVFAVEPVGSAWAVDLPCSVNPATGDRSCTGRIPTDNDLFRIEFPVGAASDVVFQTLSYFGGTNAVGNTILPGGFDPIISLFDGEGNFVISSLTNAPVQHVPGDATLSTTLLKGEYIVLISQYDNDFSITGLTDNFTSKFGCSQGIFCDVQGNNRSGSWALDIKGVKGEPSDPDPDPSPVPLPGAFWLFAFATAGLGAYRRYNNR